MKVKAVGNTADIWLKKLTDADWTKISSVNNVPKKRGSIGFVSYNAGVEISDVTVWNISSDPIIVSNKRVIDDVGNEGMLTAKNNTGYDIVWKSDNEEVVKVEENKKQLQVMSGSVKMWVNFSDCKVKKKSSPSTEMPKKRNITGISSRMERNVKSEIDIRGLTTDEALIELDKYIDEAVLAGIGTITIIHGKGTGVLRKNVQAHLRNHRNIKSFRVGLFGEGENGVTIAEITD